MLREIANFPDMNNVKQDVERLREFARQSTIPDFKGLSLQYQFDFVLGKPVREIEGTTTSICWEILNDNEEQTIGQTDYDVGLNRRRVSVPQNFEKWQERMKLTKSLSLFNNLDRNGQKCQKKTNLFHQEQPRSTFANQNCGKKMGISPPQSQYDLKNLFQLDNEDTDMGYATPRFFSQDEDDHESENDSDFQNNKFKSLNSYGLLSRETIPNTQKEVGFIPLYTTIQQLIQYIDLESSALVERLLNDFLKTTVGFNNLKTSNDKIQKEKKHADEQDENERVVRENNELHSYIIKVKEEKEEHDIQWRKTQRALLSEKDDLKFLSEQKESRIRSIETELLRSKEQLDLNLQKAYKESDGRVEQDIQFSNNYLEGGLENKENHQSHDNQQWADELRKADERGAKFRDESRKLELEKQEVIERLNQYKLQIDTRDNEISRLNQLYEGGQNMDALYAKHVTNTNSKTVQHLQSQVDFMNTENHRIEGELRASNAIIDGSKGFINEKKGMTATITNLQNKNQSLIGDFQRMETLIGELKCQKSSEVDGFKGKILVEVEELDRYRTDLEQYQELSDRQRVEIDELKEKMRTNMKDTSSFQSDKKAFHENFEKMSQEIESYKVQLDQEKQSKNDLLHQINEVRDKSNQYQQQAVKFEKQVTVTQDTQLKQVESITEKDSHEIILQQRITKLETDCDIAHREKNDIKFKLEKTIKDKERVEIEMDKFKYSSMRAQGDMESNNVIVNRVQLMYEGAKNELDILKNGRLAMESDLMKTKEKCFDMEKKSNDYYQQMQAAKENFDIIKQEQQLLSEELTNKQMELQKTEKMRIVSERELIELKPLKERYEQAQQQSHSQLSNTLKIENDKQRLQNKITELIGEIDLYKSEMVSLEEKNHSQNIYNQELVEQLRNLERESFEISTKVKRNIESQGDIQVTQKIIDEMRLKEKEYVRQIEKVQYDYKVKTEDMKVEISRNEDLKRYSAGIENEVKILKQQIIGLQSQLNDGQNINVRNEQAKTNNEIDIVNAQHLLECEIQEKKRAIEDLSIVQRDLQDERQNNINLHTNNQRLQSLLESLDKAKEELLMRLQSSTQERRTDEGERLQMLNEIQNVKKDTVSLEGENNELKGSIIQLDTRIDNLQNELDNKTEELHRVKKDLLITKDGYEETRHQLTIFSGKEENVSRRIVDREQEIKQLKLQIQQLLEQVEEFRQIAHHKTHAVNELSEDIDNLTKENQAVNEELMKTNQTRDQFKEYSDQLSSQSQYAKQALRSVELDKEDVMTNYKKVCQENERLVDSLQSVTYENKQMFQQIQHQERELSGAQHHISNFEAIEQNMLNEIQALERQKDQLTRQMEFLQLAAQDSDNAREQLLHDVQNAQQLRYSMEANKDDLVRQMSHTDTIKHRIQEELRDINSQLEIQKKQTEYERQRYHDLEMIVSKERHSLHSQDSVTIQMRQQLDAKNEDNEQLRSRVINLQSHIDTLQKYGDQDNDSTHMRDIIRDLEIRINQINEEKLYLEKQNRQLNVSTIQCQEYVKEYDAQIKDYESQSSANNSQVSMSSQQ